jgi:S1-C subfamily serine protease
MHKSISLVATLVFLGILWPARAGAPPVIGEKTADELERRVRAVYGQVRPALIRCNAENAAQFGDALLVTAEGHVLLPAGHVGKRFTAELADGRRVTGTALVRSEEWGIAVAKLDGPGPWPHVKLDDRSQIRAGQRVVTFGYSPLDATLVPEPMPGLACVSRVAPGAWFMLWGMRSWQPTRPTRQPTFVFDLDSHLVGIGGAGHFWYGEGMVYTDRAPIQALWADLVAGKNVDELRLAGGANRVVPQEKEAAEKAAIPQAMQEKAAQATVCIRQKAKDRGWSGVLVSRDGLIATCAHHFVMPGTKVFISLPDGRDASGKIVGINLVCDIGIVQITDPGPWPYVELGDSIRLRPGNPCLSIGYGSVTRQERKPTLRLSKIVASGVDQWEYLLGTDPKVPFIGGDSGGGIFDAEGRLVAIHKQLGGRDPAGVLPPHKHPRVELFRLHREDLNAPFEEITSPSPAIAEPELKQIAARARPSVVEVCDGSKIVALGTILGRGGQVITKASVLPKTPTCRLSDGRMLPATVVKIVRESDLAVLKIAAVDLPVAERSALANPPVSTLALMSAARKEPAIGIISYTPVTFPPERGVLWAAVRDSPRGLVVEKAFEDYRPVVLRAGDIVRSINDQPTPDKKTFYALFNPKEGEPIVLAGDQLRLLVVRDDKEIELRCPLPALELPRPDGQSPRYSGFAGVFSVAVESEAPLGGPILDRHGCVLGVAIAWRARGWLLVIPAATAEAMFRD